jgi:hypothetical protein
LATPVAPLSVNEALNVANEGFSTMKRMSTLLTIVVAMECCAPALSAAAEIVSHRTVKPTSAQGHKAPMRHDQLTLYPHGKPARRQSPYGSAYNRFSQPSPIHNTFMGVQRW